jgi:hypothetical protein
LESSQAKAAFQVLCRDPFTISEHEAMSADHADVISAFQNNVKAFESAGMLLNLLYLIRPEFLRFTERPADHLSCNDFRDWHDHPIYPHRPLGKKAGFAFRKRWIGTVWGCMFIVGNMNTIYFNP